MAPSRSAQRRASGFHGRDGELTFAFVRALGTDLRPIDRKLSAQLRSAGFGDEPVKLSELLEDLDVHDELDDSTVHRRYATYMDMGDQYRSSSSAADAVALLGVREISRLRNRRSEALKKRPYPERFDKRGWSYRISSLMTPNEVATLRQVNGSQFFVISVGSPQESRLDKLAADISRSIGKPADECVPIAMGLLNRDAGHMPGQGGVDLHPDIAPVGDAVEKEWRVDVEKTFHRADVFVSPDRKRESLAVIERFVDLLFSHPFHTPTKDELGMYIAQGFARRSSALGRRVGAAIASPDGEFVVGGANEVAKPGGGFYWEGEEPDFRDFQLGYDSNDVHTKEVLTDLLARLVQGGWIKSKGSRGGAEQVADELLEDPEFRDSRLLDVIEFGRAVHAEMAALTEAARRRVGVEGCTLYCTTFPCHECARHIVAAGIKRVVYIEAYPKSRVAELYPDSIGLAAIASETGQRVSFEPFVGIGPRRFEDLFSWVPRKKADLDPSDSSGEAVEWDLSEAKLRPSVVPPDDEYKAPREQARVHSEQIAWRKALLMRRKFKTRPKKRRPRG